MRQRHRERESHRRGIGVERKRGERVDWRAVGAGGGESSRPIDPSTYAHDAISRGRMLLLLLRPCFLSLARGLPSWSCVCVGVRVGFRRAGGIFAARARARRCCVFRR